MLVCRRRGSFVQTFTVVWISVYIFLIVAFLIQPKRRRYEVAGVAIVVFSFPSCSPGSRTSQTRTGLTARGVAWLRELTCQTDLKLVLPYLLAIYVVPHMFLLLLGLTLMGAALLLLVRKGLTSYIRHQQWLAIKEIVPLMFYPSLYLVVFLASKQSVLISAIIVS